MKSLIFYYLVLNFAAFFAMGLDKAKAKVGAWRIPESVLLGLGAIGGALGLWCGIYVFHHKTRRLKFTLTAPLLLLAHGGMLYYLILR